MLCDLLDSLVVRHGPSPHLAALAAAARGMVAHLEGEFFRVPELFAEQSRLMADTWTESTRFEMDNARVLWLGALGWLGRIKEVRQFLPPFLEEGLARQNVHIATHARSGVHVLLPLADDDVVKARAELQLAMLEWSPHGEAWWRKDARRANVPHLLDVFGRTPDRSLRRRTRAARTSGSTARGARSIGPSCSAQFLRIHMLNARARSRRWPSRSSRRTPAARRTLLAEAERDASRLEAERMQWSVPQGALVHAAVAYQRGDLRRATTELDRALKGFESARLGAPRRRRPPTPRRNHGRRNRPRAPRRGGSRGCCAKTMRNPREDGRLARARPRPPLTAIVSGPLGRRRPERALERGGSRLRPSPRGS